MSCFVNAPQPGKEVERSCEGVVTPLSSELPFLTLVNFVVLEKLLSSVVDRAESCSRNKCPEVSPDGQTQLLPVFDSDQ